MKRLYDESAGVCGICERHGPIDDMSRDHKVAKSRGGSDARSNIQLAHKECNRAKGSKLSVDQRAAREKRERLMSYHVGVVSGIGHGRSVL